jgi:hypothetical protein
MDTEQENTDQTEESLYDAAIAPDPTPAEAEVTEDRARDERGRFAAKEEKEEVPPVAEAAPIEPQAEKVDHRIPLTELLNEREKRQSEQRQREALQRELEQLRQQMQPQKQPEPVPDQFANPDAYNQYWAQQLDALRAESQQSKREQEANFSLRLARMEHGAELFDAAYQAVLANPNAAREVAASPDPGQTMVDWYKREQVIAQVGTNPEEYVQKKLEEALSDPEFLAKALERARGVASTQPTQVKLPPSLNKAASASRSDDTADMSDRGLYHHAIGR